MQRQKSRVIEQKFVGKSRIETAVETGIDQFLAQLCVSRNTGFGNSQPFLNGAVVVFGAADAKARHAIEKKVGPVLDGEGDDRIGF